jgi:PQQ-dependent dehydrogenase (methanol/ethanol family)
MKVPTQRPVMGRWFGAGAVAAGALGLGMSLAAAQPAQTPAQVTPPPHDGPLHALTPVPAKMLLNPPDNDWLMWRRTYDAWGYSPLKQIDTDNVKNLTVAWSWAMTPGATETTPMVHDGVLFLYNYLDKVQALDATNGELLWEYKRDIPPEVARQNGNNGAKRNMAMVDDKLIVATTDAHIIALDMKTGKVIWDHETEDYKKGWRYTGGPLVASNVIVQGMTGCGNANPGGCLITGHDISTGKELWRFHTVAQPGEPGGDSWNGLPLEKRFGASTWNSGSYDPETDTLFLGVGQPYPHVAEIGGLLPKKDGADNDALYTDSTLALDPHTGKLKWYYQHLRDDTWDLDYAYERVLVDIPVDGKVRKAMVTVGKLGIIEVLDRTNGQWLWSKQTVYRRQDHQPGCRAAYRQDHHQLPGRPRQPRLARHRLQPAHAHAVHSAERILFRHHADPDRGGQDLHRRQPCDLCAPADPEQRRQHRPHGWRRPVQPEGRVVRPHPRAADWRSTRHRRRPGVFRRARSLLPGL